MKRILSYLVGRIILTIPMLFVLLTLLFIVLRVMPGDPVSAMLGGHAPESVIQAKKQMLGLNKPIWVQYFDYLGQLARLDLGESMIIKERVTTPILQKLPATIELTLAGLIVTLGLGVPLGVRAARRRRTSHDSAIRIFANVTYCIPVFWMGLLLQMVLGVFLDLFPISGRIGSRVTSSDFQLTGFYVIDTILKGNFTELGDVLWHLVLPAVTLGVYLSGVFIRLTRANMLDTLKSDFVLAARARGVAEGRVVYGHALKNALIPIVTMLGLEFAALLAGAVLTESTFSWPGMGRLLLERIYLRDYPVIQGVIVVYALFVALISLLVDIVYAIIDPRVKL
jgi:peptide/nickel transport system permease protein